MKIKRANTPTALILSNTRSEFLLQTLDIIEAILGLEARLVLVSFEKNNLSVALQTVISANIIGCELLLILWEVPPLKFYTDWAGDVDHIPPTDEIAAAIDKANNIVGEEPAYQAFLLYSALQSSGNIEPIRSKNLEIGSLEVDHLANMVWLNKKTSDWVTLPNTNKRACIESIADAIATQSITFLDKNDKWVEIRNSGPDDFNKIVPIFVTNADISKRNCAALNEKKGECLKNDWQLKALIYNQRQLESMPFSVYENIWTKSGQEQHPKVPVFGCCLSTSTKSESETFLKHLNGFSCTRMHACLCDEDDGPVLGGFGKILNNLHPAVLWSNPTDDLTLRDKKITPAHLILRDVLSLSSKYPVVRTIHHFSDDKYPKSIKGVTHILLTAIEDEKMAIINSGRLNYCCKIGFPDDLDNELSELYLVNLNNYDKGKVTWRPFLLGQTGKGRVNAQAFIQHCLTFWPVEAVLLTGISASFAGVKEKEPNLGDIVIPIKFADYAMTKVSQEKGKIATTGKHLETILVDHRYQTAITRELMRFRNTNGYKVLINKAWAAFLLNAEKNTIIDIERLKSSCQKRLGNTECPNALFNYLLRKANEGLPKLQKAKNATNSNQKDWWDNLKWEISFNITNKPWAPSFIKIQESLLKIHSNKTNYIVTGDTVLADTNYKRKLLKLVKKNWGEDAKNNVHALDMESYGIAHTAHYWPRVSPSIKIGVIRVISDDGENKSDDDPWRKLSEQLIADYALRFLQADLEIPHAT